MVAGGPAGPTRAALVALRSSAARSPGTGASAAQPLGAARRATGPAGAVGDSLSPPAGGRRQPGRGRGAMS